MATDQENKAFNEHIGKDTNLVKASVDLKTEKHGWMEVEHGITDEGDYVWHFSNHHKHRTFPSNLYKVKQIIVTYLSKVIPDTVTVRCIDPPADWEKKVITIKAEGLVKKWNFDEEAMAKHLPKIGELISVEVELANPRRTHS